MKRINKRNRIGIILILLVAMISCRDSSEWYPTGLATVSSFSEATDASGNKYCTVFYCIENTGNSKISLSTISFKVVTDKNEYYVTKINENAILPEGKIWDSFTVTYFDSTEVSTKDNISIEDSFYE